VYHLARSAHLPTGSYILLALISFVFFSFLMITWRTIISGSAGPIFAILSPNESVLGAVPISQGPQGMLQWQSILWKNGKLPSFVALAFRNRMGYCYLNVRINTVNDASISCKKFRTYLTDFRNLFTVWKRFVCRRSTCNLFSDLSRDVAIATK